MYARRWFSLLLAPALIVLSHATVAAENSPSASQDDATITARVEAALRDRKLMNSQSIEIETREGLVQLSGFVESEEQQERALDAARAVAGVVSVRNDLVVREAKPTVGAALDDTIIAAKVRQELKDKTTPAAGDIQVEVSSGVVQLSGFVPSIEAKTRAADIASTVEGVRDVRNDIALEK